MDLHVVHSSVIIPYSGRLGSSQGGKISSLDDDLHTQFLVKQFLDPPPNAAMLRKPLGGALPAEAIPPAAAPIPLIP